MFAICLSMMRDVVLETETVSVIGTRNSRKWLNKLRLQLPRKKKEFHQAKTNIKMRQKAINKT